MWFYRKYSGVFAFRPDRKIGFDLEGHRSRGERVGDLAALGSREVVPFEHSSGGTDKLFDVFAGEGNGVRSVAVVELCGLLDGVIPPLVVLVGPDPNRAGRLIAGHAREHEPLFLDFCGHSLPV